MDSFRRITFSPDLSHYLLRYMNNIKLIKSSNHQVTMDIDTGFGQSCEGFIGKKSWCFIGHYGRNTFLNLETKDVYSYPILTRCRCDVWKHVHPNPDGSILAVHGYTSGYNDGGRCYFFDFSNPEKGCPELEPDKYFDLPFKYDDDIDIVWLDNITCKLFEKQAYHRHLNKWYWDVSLDEEASMKITNDKYETRMVSEVVLQKVGDKMNILDSHTF